MHPLTARPIPMEHKKAERKAQLLVGIPGLEPGMTGPESVVLPLHHIPIVYFCNSEVKKPSEMLSFLVGIPGLEPGMTGPESVVLPLHHIPISVAQLRNVIYFLIAVAKVRTFSQTPKLSRSFFNDYLYFSEIMTKSRYNSENLLPCRIFPGCHGSRVVSSFCS